MNIKLSDHIRSFRKARSLTQQQLAEALGVTVGAVYKWEADLSAPDISLLIELADLFDTSVDVLLGYEMKNNQQAVTLTRLREYLHNKDEQGPAEADKAVIRYPNSFQIIHQSAVLYYMFGLMHHDEKMLQRSLELMERSILLIGQNTDPEISELSIYDDIASIYSLLNKDEQAVELLKRHNPCGIFNASIGLLLGTVCNQSEEAVRYLSMALLDNTISLIHLVMGYFNVFLKKQDYASAAGILNLALNFLSVLKEQGKTSFLDKTSVSLYTCLAMVQTELGDIDSAREALRTAKTIAEEFDSMPDYQVDSIRFIFTGEKKTAFDDMGATAMECIPNTLKDGGNEILLAIWEEINHEE